jgi:hypothetical protein
MADIRKFFPTTQGAKEKPCLPTVDNHHDEEPSDDEQTSDVEQSSLPTDEDEIIELEFNTESASGKTESAAAGPPGTT